IQALRPEHDPELVHAMDRVVSNTRFTQGEVDAWYALRKAHANPDCAWQYDFVRIPDVEGSLDAEPVAVQSKRLSAALVAIEGFARVSGETFWADAFRAAHAVLDGAEATEHVRGWFDGTGMAPDAFRLLAASVAADVFGGMGSWNDLSPKDGAGYSRVSADLFRELQPSLISAVNSTAGPGRST
ncbi:MAG TPA: hypothetical protein VND21_03320, partial [Planctomycetota bacterium]|nr:hypothetical protein [Planctomycetota bacterium]